MKKIFFNVLFVLLSLIVKGQGALLIYGGADNKTFLGCLDCNKFSSQSIWSQFGNYGSKFSSTSIWNQFGTYGSEFSSYSPFNEFASNPPILVDGNGNFFGYFTANKYKAKRANSSLVEYIIDYHKSIRDDVGKYYDLIFN